MKTSCSLLNVFRKNSGFTTVEICTVIIILGVLSAGGASIVSRFGSDGRVEYEANKLVDHLWQLRASASTGMRNPCIEFPSASTMRLFSDSQDNPDGFGPGDKEILVYTYSGGVRSLSIAGGTGPSHYVCFESRGMAGSAGAPLVVVLGGNSGRTKSIRLLPATGSASVR